MGIKAYGFSDNKCVVELWVRKKQKKVAIDVKVTPLYCGKCRKELKRMYLLDGSRYGQVGTVQCDFCSARIDISDNDNLVDGLRLFNGKRYDFLDYERLYRLEDTVWEDIKECTGYDIFAAYETQQVCLEKVMQEIKQTLPVPVPTDLPADFTVHEYIKNNIHSVIKEWIALLIAIKPEVYGSEGKKKYLGNAVFSDQ